MNTEIYVILAAVFSTFFSIYKVKQIVDDGNKRLGGVYKRIEESDKENKNIFVENNMCNLRHDFISKDFIRLENKVDRGFQSLEDKFSKLLKMNGN